MGLYDLQTLLGVMRYQRSMAPNFWLSFFGTTINFDTPTILWDKVYEDTRKLAPFVIPTAQGRPQRLPGYTTVSFAPAYIKIKDVVHAQMHIQRLAGEQLNTGSMTIEQRRNAVIAYLLGMQKTKINNRFEWLAARAIIDGEVTIVGEDYPSTLVDFRRDNALSAVLAGTARWTETGTADPMGDLRTMRKLVESKSGQRITKHVFGGDAWDYFCARVDLKDMMNRNYGGLSVDVTRMWDGYEGMEYMGTIAGSNGAGRIEAWVNTSKYVDDTGTEQFFLDQKTVVGVSDAVAGVRCFGAIMDQAAGYRPLEIFTKNWLEQDPSVEFLLAQSAPLMVPRNPDATYKLKVAT